MVDDTIALAELVKEIDALYSRADAPWHVNPAKPPREVKLKRPHWEIGQPFGKGIGIIFGDDISTARLIEKLFNAWPAIRAALRANRAATVPSAEDRDRLAKSMCEACGYASFPGGGTGFQTCADVAFKFFAPCSPVHAGGAEVSESERLHAVIENEAIVSRDALAEVERLRERCEGYKGQIEAGSIAIQHLQGEIDRLRKALEKIAFITGGIDTPAASNAAHYEAVNAITSGSCRDGSG